MASEAIFNLNKCFLKEIGVLKWLVIGKSWKSVKIGKMITKRHLTIFLTHCDCSWKMRKYFAFLSRAGIHTHISMGNFLYVLYLLLIFCRWILAGQQSVWTVRTSRTLPRQAQVKKSGHEKKLLFLFAVVIACNKICICIYIPLGIYFQTHYF